MTVSLFCLYSETWSQVKEVLERRGGVLALLHQQAENLLGALPNKLTGLFLLPAADIFLLS